MQHEHCTLPTLLSCGKGSKSRSLLCVEAVLMPAYRRPCYDSAQCSLDVSLWAVPDSGAVAQRRRNAQRQIRKTCLHSWPWVLSHAPAALLPNIAIHLPGTCYLREASSIGHPRSPLEQASQHICYFGPGHLSIGPTGRAMHHQGCADSRPHLLGAERGTSLEMACRSVRAPQLRGVLMCRPSAAIRHTAVIGHPPTRCRPLRLRCRSNLPTSQSSDHTTHGMAWRALGLIR